MAHHVQKYFARGAAREDEMKTVSMLKMRHRERRSELVVTCPALTKDRQETIPVGLCRVDMSSENVAAPYSTVA